MDYNLDRAVVKYLPSIDVLIIRWVVETLVSLIFQIDNWSRDGYVFG